MTPKQKQFVEAYLGEANLSANAAYRKVFPKAKPESVEANSYRMMADDGVKAAIDGAIKKREAESGITAAWVLKRLKLEAEREGPDASHAARVSATGLAMKHLGMLKEDAPHPDRHTYDFDRLTPDQQTALLAALRSLFAPRLVGTDGAAASA